MLSAHCPVVRSLWDAEIFAYLSTLIGRRAIDRIRGEAFYLNFALVRTAGSILQQSSHVEQCRDGKIRWHLI